MFLTIAFLCLINKAYGWAIGWVLLHLITEDR